MEFFLILVSSFAFVGLIVFIIHKIVSSTKSGKTSLLFNKLSDKMDKAKTAADVEECIGILDEMLEVDPDSVMALGLKATILGNMGKEDEALACYKRSLEIEPYNLMTHKDIGFFYLKELKDEEKASRHFDEALDLLVDMIAKNPSEMDYRLFEIDILEVHRTDARKLMECYGYIVDNFVFTAGESKFLYGKVKNAVDLLLQNKDGINVDQLIKDIARLEILMREDKTWNEAEMVNLINMFKDAVNRHSGKNIDLSETKEPVEVTEEPIQTNSEILKDIESSLLADPGDVEALKKKAAYYVFSEPDYAEALIYMDKVIEYEPDDSSYLLKATLLSETDDVNYIRKADECYNHLLQNTDISDENSEFVWRRKIELAQQILHLGTETLENVLALIDKYARLHFSIEKEEHLLRAYAYANAGEEYFDKAIEYADRSIARNISTKDFYYFKATMYQARQKYDEALNCLDEALSVSDDDAGRAVIYTLMSEIYVAAGNVEKANDYAQKVKYLETVGAFSGAMDEIK